MKKLTTALLTALLLLNLAACGEKEPDDTGYLSYRFFRVIWTNSSWCEWEH